MGLCTVPVAEKTTGLILGLINIFFPGVGAIVAAVLLQASSGELDTALLVAGILMLFTSWLLVGWIWAIVWGVQVITKATDEPGKAEIDLGLNKAKDVNAPAQPAADAAVPSDAAPAAPAPVAGPVDVENPTAPPPPPPPTS